MPSFGELLAELRKDKGMTQRKLSEVLHVSVGTISNYEKGVYFPDLEKLMNLADYFQVTTDYLLGRCEYNLSPDVFNTAVADGKTVGEFIQELCRLPENRRQILVTMMSDMEFRTAINRYNKEELQ